MRLLNWQTRLSAAIENARHKPFDFPAHNCLMWAFDAVEAVTGERLHEPYAGKYKSPASARRLMLKVDGVDNCRDLLIGKLGEPRPVAFARPGDIVFGADLPLPGGDLFGMPPGVCYGLSSYFVGESGLVELPTLSLKDALWAS